MTTPLVAEFTKVTKEYRSLRNWSGRLKAVDDVSLGVRSGEVTGLLGPNRAGKTTLVKLLLSLCRPTSGQVTRLGHPARLRATLARVGYAHELPAFPKHLTPLTLLEFLGTLSEVPRKTLTRRIPELLQRFDLADCAREPLRRFSKGMVQRLVLAQALINDPELLILDEPFEGLDLAARHLLHRLLRERAERGLACLLVTHAVESALRISDTIAVLSAGRLVYHGAPADLHSAEHLPPGWSSALAEAPVGALA
jgi:ABC-2 type transport system ATP-binding protein